MTKRVLVLDFDINTRKATVSLLRGRGIDVVEAGSMDEFTRALIPGAPDVALVEPDLPGVDCAELCSLIHGNSSGSPAIILGSHKLRAEALKMRASQIGATLFFERPIADPRLLQAVTDAVAKASATAGAANPPRLAPARMPERPGVPAAGPKAHEKVELTNIGNSDFDGWLDNVFSGIEDMGTAAPPAPPAPVAPPAEPASPVLESQPLPSPPNQVSTRQQPPIPAEPAPQTSAPRKVADPFAMDSFHESLPQRQPTPSASASISAPDSVVPEMAAWHPDVDADPLGVQDQTRGGNTASNQLQSSGPFPNASPAAFPAGPSPRSHLPEPLPSFSSDIAPSVLPPEIPRAAEPLLPPSRSFSLPWISVALLLAAAVGGFIAWQRFGPSPFPSLPFAPRITVSDSVSSTPAGANIPAAVDTQTDPDPNDATDRIQRSLTASDSTARADGPEGTESGAREVVTDPTPTPEPMSNEVARPNSRGRAFLRTDPPVRQTPQVIENPPAKSKPTETIPRAVTVVQPQAQAQVSTPTPERPRTVPTETVVAPESKPTRTAPSPRQPAFEDFASAVPEVETATPEPPDTTSIAAPAATPAPVPIERMANPFEFVRKTARPEPEEVKPVEPIPVKTIQAVLIESSRVLPQIPPAARRFGIFGSVTMQIEILADGSIGGVTILSEPKGNAGLGKAAANSVRRWRYHPATADGDPIDSVTEVRVVFEP